MMRHRRPKSSSHATAHIGASAPRTVCVKRNSVILPSNSETKKRSGMQATEWLILSLVLLHPNTLWTSDIRCDVQQNLRYVRVAMTALWRQP